MPAGYGKGGYDGSGTQGGMDSGMGVVLKTMKLKHLKTFCKKIQAYKLC